MVRLEGLGIGTAGNGVQHRRFNFQKIVRHHEVANAADCLAARHKTFARRFVHHQIDVALAVFGFLIGHAVEFVRHGAQAFGQQAQRRCVNRQLAGFGLEHAALSGHDVPQIPMLEPLVELCSKLFALDVNLHTPCAGAKRGILHRAEAGLAHYALEHHAARHFSRHVQRHQLLGGFVVKRGKQRLGMVGGFEIIREGHAFAVHLRLADGLEFFAPLDDELVFV